jgi:hypothetical protein
MPSTYHDSSSSHENTVSKYAREGELPSGIDVVTTQLHCIATGEPWRSYGLTEPVIVDFLRRHQGSSLCMSAVDVHRNGGRY